MHVWNRFQTIFFSMETFMIFLVPLFGRIRLQNETASPATCLESKNGSGKCSTVIFKDCSSFTWSVTAKNGTLQNVFFFKNLSETVGPWRGQKQKLMAPQKLDMSGSKFPWAFSWTVFFPAPCLAVYGQKMKQRSLEHFLETKTPGNGLGRNGRSNRALFGQ